MSMIHLAVAVRLRKLTGRTPTPEFLLGSLAPDAIDIRSGATPEEKRHVHLDNATEGGVERVLRWLGEARATGSLPCPLAEGYAVHLLTDAVWVQDVAPSLRASENDNSGQAPQYTLYQQAAQVEFDLYQRMPWRPAVWAALAKAQPADIAGLVTADEIGRWRDRTLIWFDQLEVEPGIVPDRITYDLVIRFIEHAAVRLSEILA